MLVKLRDVVNRVNNNIDRFNTNIKYYLGKGHGECGEIAITEHGNLQDDVGMLGFKFHFAFKPKDTLFFSRSFALRKAGMAMYEGLCSDSTYILRSKDESVLCPEYLPAIIQSDNFWDYCDTHHTGGVNFLINWSTLADYEFDLPTLLAQRELADKLWAAYHLKESYKRLLAATDEMVKSQFIEMVGEPRTNPKGWQVCKLPDIASYSIGLTYKPEHVCDNGTIVLRSGNIQNGQIVLDDLVRVNSPIKDSLWVKEGDILMCSRNGSASLVGKVAQIKSVNKPMTYGAFMTIIRSEYSDFLYLYFQSTDFREQISGGKSSTMNQITQKMLDKIELLMPDRNTLSRLSSILQQADKSKYLS